MRRYGEQARARFATATGLQSCGSRPHDYRFRVLAATAAAAIACAGLAASAAPADAAPWLGLRAVPGAAGSGLDGAALAAHASPALPTAADFRTVDVPGAYGTEVNAVNDHGVLAGTYFADQGADMFGFIEDGTHPITLNYPNTSGVTLASAIDDHGDVLGLYTDPTGTAHGWIRSRDGNFSQIDEPQAANGPGLGTVLNAINDAGVIVGYYEDANNVAHAIIDNHGTFKTIDAPGAGTMSGQGTSFDGITDTGVIVGFYIDTDGVSHGFVYTSDRFIGLDPPGAGTAPGQGTYTAGITQDGVIAGDIENENGYSGWLLSSRRFLTLHDPHAATGFLGSESLGTFPFDIDSRGHEVSGAYYDADGVEHGFVATLST